MIAPVSIASFSSRDKKPSDFDLHKSASFGESESSKDSLFSRITSFFTSGSKEDAKSASSFQKKSVN